MTVDLETAWAMTRSQRWFSGHSRAAQPLSVTVGDPISAERWAPRSVLLDVGYPDDSIERYHLPVVRDGDAWADACDHQPAMLALVEALAEERPGFTRFRELPHIDRPRRFSGEQSNTSVFYGRLLLKVFRRLEVGSNLDVEIHRALAGTGLVAEIYGVWQAGGVDLGVFLQALKDPLDGFVLARDAARTGTDFTSHAHALGVSLAGVHHGLAEVLETGTGSREGLRSMFEAHYRQAAAEVPQLAEAEPVLRRVLDDLGDGTFPTQRIHGDCHMGQVLLSDGQWRWVDFEGEPLKSLEERRRPDSPLRDIAGMLRSFGYAAADAPDPGWEGACRAAFLDGYGLTDLSENALLRAYEIDKAIYEVVYEARNRPTWLHIPLRALQD